MPINVYRTPIDVGGLWGTEIAREYF